MVIAGISSGALVAALPAAAVAAAPPTDTGFVTGMTNTTKTLGGAVASSVFAIDLSATGSLDAGSMSTESTAASAHPTLGGYLVVWTVCGATALIAAIALAVRMPDRTAAQ